MKLIYHLSFFKELVEQMNRAKLNDQAFAYSNTNNNFVNNQTNSNQLNQAVSSANAQNVSTETHIIVEIRLSIMILLEFFINHNYIDNRISL